MPSYRTPLPAMLAASLQTAINQLLAMDESSAQRLAVLHQRVVQLDLENLGITLFFGFDHARVTVSLEAEGEPDTVVSGSPAALFAMAMPDDGGNWGMPGSRVKISGDATLARDLERVFSRLQPDFEGQLSNWFGDVLGYQLAAGARGAAAQAKQSAATLEDITGDFLNRPNSPVASAAEITDFSAAVDRLRDATERLEARLRILQQRQQAADDNGEHAS